MADLGTVILNVLNNGISIAAPLLIAALGEAFAERSGVMNLAIEGIMSLGAALAYIVAFLSGDLWLGLLVGILGGLLIALVNAFLSQTLYFDQVITGMSLYIFAYGLSIFVFRALTGHVSTFGLNVPRFRSVEVPFLSAVPFLGLTIFRQNVLIYIALALALILEFIMFKTTIGLRLRAVGENPRAADNAGINVYVVRYLSVLWAGAMAGLAGGYLALAELGLFFEGMTAGRGWIAIAIVIFGQWSPLRIVAASLLFGFIESSGLHILVTAPQIPYQFVLILPFVISIAVLVIAFKRAVLPAALFKPYRREEAGR